MGISTPPEGNLDLRTDDGQNYYYVWITYRENGIIEHRLGHKGWRASIEYFVRETFPRPYPRSLPIVHRPPGSRLLNIVEFLYSPSAREKVFEPLIADWRLEYFEALAVKKPLKAKWISVRYYWAFCKAMGLQRLLSVIYKMALVTKSDD